MALRPHNRRSAEPFRGLRDRSRSRRGLLAPAPAGVLGARLHGVGRLYGPGELGDRPRGWIEVRLHAALGHHDFQSDGHSAAGALGPAWYSDGARSGAGVPRFLFAAGWDRALAGLRIGDHRLRSGRGYRHGHRAQVVVWHPADWRGTDHCTRCLPAADANEQGLPLPGSVHHRVAGRDRGLFPDPDRAGGAAGRGRVGRLRAVDADRDQSGDALHRHRHPRRDGDAAQSLSALLDRADPPLRAR